VPPGLNRKKPILDYIGGVWNPGSSNPEPSCSGRANRFCAYLNWYQIDQHNVIGTLQAQTVVDLAAAGVTLPRNYVARSPGGRISEVVNTYENLGDTRNDGIEFGFNYVTKEYNWRKLGLEFRASYLSRTR
jgi:TonB dependent receptor